MPGPVKARMAIGDRPSLLAHMRPPEATGHKGLWEQLQDRAPPPVQCASSLCMLMSPGVRHTPDLLLRGGKTWRVGVRGFLQSLLVVVPISDHGM